MEQIDHDRIALVIKQPWAELVLQGIKTLEVRTRPIQVRGTIYLYTSKKNAKQSFALKAIKKHQLDESSLPQGMIVGTVEIVDCRKATPSDSIQACVPKEVLKRQYVWEMESPVTFPKPVSAICTPYGNWFYPFRK